MNMTCITEHLCPKNCWRRSVFCRTVRVPHWSNRPLMILKGYLQGVVYQIVTSSRRGGAEAYACATEETHGWMGFEPLTVRLTDKHST
jgi:hypothetical protein